MRTTADPKINSFFSRESWQGMGSEGRYTFLKEGEKNLSDTSQKDHSERQRDWRGIGIDTAFFVGY